MVYPAVAIWSHVMTTPLSKCSTSQSLQMMHPSGTLCDQFAWDGFVAYREPAVMNLSVQQGTRVQKLVCVEQLDVTLHLLCKWLTDSALHAVCRCYRGHSSHVTNVRFLCDDRAVVSVGSHDRGALNICDYNAKLLHGNPR